ncbi:MAG: hypothetical protein O7H41_09280 [Planctomycetota bacterium]|nr:hypothetical protein [Planctomycetota bacterium]
MIRVNLLPERFREAPSASWSVLLTFIIVILAVAGVGVAAMLTKFSADSAQANLDTAKANAEVLRVKAEVHTRLVREIDEEEKRMTTIKDIAQSKINWAKKLDELTGLILQDDMWIHELELLEGTRKAGPGGVRDFGKLKIQCFFSGTSTAPVNTFYQNLRSNRSFFSIFRDVSQPSANKRDIEDVYKVKFVDDQKLNVQSTFELHLAPRGQDLRKPNKDAKP